MKRWPNFLEEKDKKFIPEELDGCASYNIRQKKAIKSFIEE